MATDPEAIRDEQRLFRALTIAYTEFVFWMDKGLDTVLGERGTGLSEGQMQRIAIARAIFLRHLVLMLDECPFLHAMNGCAGLCRFPADL